MAQLKDTTITGGLSVSNTVNITGATQHSADVTLYSSSGDSPSLIFQRGTLGDTLNDYKVIDTSGYLTIKQQGNSGTSGFTQVAELTNQGTFTVSTPPTTDTTPSVTAWISPTDSAIKISTDVDIASGDKLVIRDSSDSNKLRSSSITFGTSTSTFLRNDGTWAAAGGSYTATTPIVIDSSDNISHAASGVTAGTYIPTAYDYNKTGVQDAIAFPTITVDSMGHITSAGSYGKVLTSVKDSSMLTPASGLMPYSYYILLLSNLDKSFVHEYGDTATSGCFTISAGSNSKTVTMAVPGSLIDATSINIRGGIIGSYNFYRVTGINSFLYNSSTSTYESVLVDWSATSATYNSSTGTYDCTVTVSTADNIPTGYTLYFTILYRQGVSK